jgi:hypothetical protein
MFGIHFFFTQMFKMGPVVFRRTVEGSFPIITKHETISMQEGNFQFLDDNQVIFRSRIQWFNLFRFSHPFPVKCFGQFYGGTVNVIGRVPLGTTVFIGFGFLTFLLFPLILIFNGEIEAWTFAPLAGALIIFIFFGLIPYQVEKVRFERMINELSEIVAKYKN